MGNLFSTVFVLLQGVWLVLIPLIWVFCWLYERPKKRRQNGL